MSLAALDCAENAQTAAYTSRSILFRRRARHHDCRRITLAHRARRNADRRRVRARLQLDWITTALCEEEEEWGDRTHKHTHN